MINEDSCLEQPEHDARQERTRQHVPGSYIAFSEHTESYDEQSHV